MRSTLSSWLLVLPLALGAAAWADDTQLKAKDELERQLKQMVGSTPTRVKVELVALDEPNYALEEASFELDGAALKAPSVAALSSDGTHLVWGGEVKPGKHSVRMRLVYASQASVVVSDEGGYKWALNGERTFDLPSGIEVQVKVSASRDGKQRDLKNRFKLATTATPVMLAALDDGKMPEPLVRPKAEVADAGVAVAAAGDSAAEKAAEKKRLADEAQKKKLDELAEKKRLADEARQRKQEALEEKKKAAAEARQRKIDEAAEKRRRAADEAAEKKKFAAEERQRKLDEASGKHHAAAEPARPPDAGPEKPPEVAAKAPEPVVAEVDAGAAAVAVAVADAGAPQVAAAQPPPEPAFPWVVVAGAVGGAAFVVMVMLIARRRSRPPSID